MSNKRRRKGSKWSGDGLGEIDLGLRIRLTCGSCGGTNLHEGQAADEMVKAIDRDPWVEVGCSCGYRERLYPDGKREPVP